MPAKSNDVMIPAGGLKLHGIWTVPKPCRGVVVFAHGSGSGRLSPRNQLVARILQQGGFATLLLDLLDESEADDRDKVFDIELLTKRLLVAVDWAAAQPATQGRRIGLFGASTGAAAALQAAGRRPNSVHAVVSRGGRPDLAWCELAAVKQPTLLIVGECDCEVLQLNRSALRLLGGPRSLCTVPGATHLFEETGALDRVASLAKGWFLHHLAGEPGDDPDRFADRADAGEHLAARLQGRAFTDPVVLAIPRGGIILGAILADRLNADLDVVLSRKLRMPGNPEFALGAIAETGEVYLNVPEGDLAPGLRSYVDEESRRQMEEIARRRELFRQGHPPVNVAGRSVIVTDDGIATGSTMIAALRTLKLQHPLEVIVAVPVAAPERLEQVRKECDDVVCLIAAPDLMAVGQYYEDFTQVEDTEVVAALQHHLAAGLAPRGVAN